MVRLVTIASLLLAVAASAEKLPSNPMLVLNQQGRPLAEGVISITNPDTGAPSVVFMDRAGTIPYNNKVPVNGVVQFFGDAGLYLVTAQGQGLTRQYYTVVTSGVGIGAGRVSIDYTAEMLSLNTVNAASLFCSQLEFVCWIEFAANSPKSIEIDFIMPSYPIVLTSALLSWHQDDANLGVTWKGDWCAYSTGETRCDPYSAGNTARVHNTSTGVNTRTDAQFTPATWSVSWLPGKHIIIVFTRDVDDVNDTSLTTASLENVRFEFTK